MTRIKKYIWTNTFEHITRKKDDGAGHTTERGSKLSVLSRKIHKYYVTLFPFSRLNLLTWISLLNRPLYICVVSTLAFEWTWGWRWLCFSINLCFVKGFVYRFSQLSLGNWSPHFDRLMHIFKNLIYCCSFCHWCEEIWTHQPGIELFLSFFLLCIKLLIVSALNIWRIYCTIRNRQGTYAQTRSRTKTCGDSGPFAVYAPRIWNSLPLNIRHSSSVSSFQKNLKTFLFKHFVKSYSLVY